MEIGARIVAEAEQWIGTPFHWQGRVRGIGCDCKGLIAGVAAMCHRAEADSLEALAGDYRDCVPVARLRSGLARLFDRADERRAGDVLLLRMGGQAQHLAIAAPVPGHPDRIIEAMPTGPAQVRPGRAGAGRVDSIWRWREGDVVCASASADAVSSLPRPAGAPLRAPGRACGMASPADPATTVTGNF